MKSIDFGNWNPVRLSNHDTVQLYHNPVTPVIWVASVRV